ncbi:class I SAM-dependent methyltransferase [Virgibacillus flavescens]|uniref:class I SAM-dependent methyltransferase n=1 Tax=Virgibacillus flavescens TaxID=1611422 RepID=UPI003D339BF5
MKKEDLIKKFNKEALKHTKQRENLRDKKWREKIFSNVRGRTLEIAVGAGMNFAFYPKSIDYTGVDFSPRMLEEAKEAAKEQHIKSSFVLSDVESLDFEENTFDSIVSSGSLCVYDNPLYVLNQMNKWCQKDGGILLYEHGLFANQALAWFQKRLNRWHLKKYGCHFDRNILEIVKKSDLDITRCERAMGGYLYLIWAKPGKHTRGKL